MSRHKFVKRMNYEAELYVFDGADAYDEDASGATEGGWGHIYIY